MPRTSPRRSRSRRKKRSPRRVYSPSPLAGLHKHVTIRKKKKSRAKENLLAKFHAAA